MMGACFYHIRQCGFGTGIFSQVVLHDLEYCCMLKTVKLVEFLTSTYRRRGRICQSFLSTRFSRMLSSNNGEINVHLFV